MDNIQLLAGVLGALLIIFLPTFLVSLWEQDSKINTFGRRLWKGSGEELLGGELITLLRGVTLTLRAVFQLFSLIFYFLHSNLIAWVDKIQMLRNQSIRYENVYNIPS